MKPTRTITSRSPAAASSAMACQREPVGSQAEPGDRPVRHGGHHRGVPERLPRRRVGDVHLDQRRGPHGQRVAQRVGVVRERGRVEHDRDRGRRRPRAPSRSARSRRRSAGRPPAGRACVLRSGTRRPGRRGWPSRRPRARGCPAGPGCGPLSTSTCVMARSTSWYACSSSSSAGSLRMPGRASPSSTTNRSRAPRAFLSTAIADRSRGQRRRRYAVGSPTEVSTSRCRARRAVVQPAGQPAELGGVDHADRHRLAVPEPESLDPLDRVPERVPVVQELPPSGLAQVRGHHGGLDPDRPLDQLARGRSGRQSWPAPGRPRPGRGWRGRR